MTSISNPYLSQRFRSLIWSCLDFELLKTAAFFAERYFYVDQDNHEARHLFATALLKSGQMLSALHLVDLPAESRCHGCIEIYAQCCQKLGRYRQGREALEKSIDTGGPSDLGVPKLLFERTVLAFSTDPKAISAIHLSREPHVFQVEAVLQSRAGTLALKANIYEKAAASFTRALALNPLLWEAFEGLCSVGQPHGDSSRLSLIICAQGHFQTSKTSSQHGQDFQGSSLKIRLCPMFQSADQVQSLRVWVFSHPKHRF